MINTKTIDRSKLDLAACAYIQVVQVDPFVEFDEAAAAALAPAPAAARPARGASRRTLTGRVIDCATFALESPFWRDAGAPKDDVSATWKRRLLLHTEHTFPYLTRRQRVAREHAVELPPIVAGAELLEKQRIEVSLLFLSFFLSFSFFFLDLIAKRLTNLCFTLIYSWLESCVVLLHVQTLYKWLFKDRFCCKSTRDRWQLEMLF